MTYSIIVPDSSPLITLAASNHILHSAVEAGRQIGIRNRRLNQAMGAFASQGQGWS